MDDGTDGARPTDGGADQPESLPWSAPSEPSMAPPPPAFPPPAFPPPVAASASAYGFPGDPFASPEPPRRRRPGLLVVGILAGVVVLAGVGYAAVRALSSVLADAVASSTEPATPGDKVYIGDLRAGECFTRADDERGDTLVTYVTVTSCTEPHDAQVYAVVPLSFETYPGDDALQTAGESACTAQDVRLDPTVKDEPNVSPNWYAPDADSWDIDDHEAACTVESDSPGGLTRSWLTADASGTPKPSSA